MPEQFPKLIDIGFSALGSTGLLALIVWLIAQQRRPIDSMLEINERQAKEIAELQIRQEKANKLIDEMRAHIAALEKKVTALEIENAKLRAKIKQLEEESDETD